MTLNSKSQRAFSIILLYLLCIYIKNACLLLVEIGIAGQFCIAIQKPAIFCKITGTGVSQWKYWDATHLVFFNYFITYTLRMQYLEK